MKYEWKTKKLSEIALINPKESISKGTFAKKVPMDKLHPFCRDIPEFVLEKYNGGTKFRNGDTIMARITPCLENGKIAKVAFLNDNEIGFGSTEYIVFRAINAISDSDFLYYLISSPLVRNTAIKSMVGSSGRQRVQTDVIAELEIALPKIEEQIKIGAFLKSLDDKIELNNKINDNLEQQISTIYKKIFSKITKDTIELEKLIEVRDGTHDSPKPQKDGYLLITSKHLLPYGIDRTSANRITEDDFNKINERSLVENGDVLMSMIGTIGIVSFIFDKVVDFAIKNIALFKTSKKIDLAFYFLSYLKSKKTQLYIEQYLAGSTQKYISLSELRKMPIVKPEVALLSQFNEIVAPMYNKIIFNSQEIVRLTALRDTLLPKLISGQLDISNIEL